MTKIYCLSLALAGLLGSITSTFAQDVPSGDGFNCSQHIETNKLFKENPELEKEYLKQEALLRIAANKKYENRFNKEDKVYRIPVVIHVIHQNGIENISFAQCQNAVDVLNDEFNGKNPAFANIVAEFKDRAADCKIEFRLATIDPQGNCTNGVDRFYDTRTVGAGDEVKSGRQWPSQKYLNIYTVASIGSGAAGYAYYPGTITADRDGVLIIHSYISRIGTGSAGTASALTHEVGHYLSLAHTWGGSNDPALPDNCNTDDGVTDTPNCIGSRDCVLNTNTCDVGTPGDEIDNIQNFMEYAYCYAMFTNGQKARMQAALESTVGSRNTLWAPANLIATGADYDLPPSNLCKADFSTSTSKPVCQGSTVTFTDMSFNNVTSWNWIFEGGTPATSTEQNPTVTYSVAGAYDVTLEASNSAQMVSSTKANVVNVVSNNALTGPYSQNFESIPVSLTPDFSVNNPNGDVTWTLGQATGYQSTKSAYLKNRVVTGTGKMDDLITNTLDLTSMAKPHLKFRYAYAAKTATSSDEMGVYISTDCGLTWNKRKVLKSTTLRTTSTTVATGDFIPAADNQWKETDVSLESFVSNGVRAKFEWINGGGNNVYIDNINFYDAATVGISESVKASYGLGIYPNPTNEGATISFTLPNQSLVHLELYDLIGKKCQDLFNGVVPAGEQETILNRDRLPSGIYFVRLSIDGNSFTQKLVLQ